MNIPTKTALRAQLRASRAALDVRFKHEAGTRLAGTVLDWLAASRALAASDGGELTQVVGAHEGPVVCAYLSVGAEPPTQPLLEALDAAGFQVFVPVCEPNFQLSWTLWTPRVILNRSLLAPVMEPVGERRSFVELGRVQAVLVPALAVDGAGARLGQGGGYYDRFLASSSAQPVAAVVYEIEFLTAGAVPTDSFDAPVGYAITPSAVHAVRRG